jgi:hypothetical protein
MRAFRPRRLPDLVVIEPAVHSDGRGFLLGTWHLDRYREAGAPSGDFDLTALLTGASGQVFRELFRLARARDVPFVGFPREALGMTESARVRSLLGSRGGHPDLLKNLAAYTDVGSAQTEREEAFRVNAHGGGILRDTPPKCIP